MKLNLLCSPASLEHNKTCADLIYDENLPTSSSFGYTNPCSIEILTLRFQDMLTLPCTMTCNNTLASYKGECCAINAGLFDAPDLTSDESIHTDRIWTECGISSPGKCPTPPLPSPTITTPSFNPTSSPNGTSHPRSGEVNIEAYCLSLLTSVALLCINYAFY